MDDMAKTLKVKKDFAARGMLDCPGKIVKCRTTNAYFYITPAKISYLPPGKIDNLFLNYLREGYEIVEALTKMKALGIPMQIIVAQYRAFLIRRNLFRYLAHSR